MPIDAKYPLPMVLVSAIDVLFGMILRGFHIVICCLVEPMLSGTTPTKLTDRTPGNAGDTLADLERNCTSCHASNSGVWDPSS